MHECAFARTRYVLEGVIPCAFRRFVLCFHSCYLRERGAKQTLLEGGRVRYLSRELNYDGLNYENVHPTN